MSFYLTITISSILAFCGGWLAANLGAVLWEKATRSYVEDIRNKLAILRLDTTYFDVIIFLYGLLFLATVLFVGYYLKLWVLALGICFLLWDVPKTIVQKLLTQRKRLLEEQLTETIGMVCNSLRAGLSLENSFQEATLASLYPLRYELDKIVYEISYGLPFQDVLIRSKNRLQAIQPYVLFTTAVVTSKKRGGNLTQVLERLKGTIQVTHELERDLESATASGKLQIKIMLYFLPLFGLLIPLMFCFGGDDLLATWLSQLQETKYQLLQLVSYIIIYIGYRVGQLVTTPNF